MNDSVVTISMRPSGVPEYLKDSDFYKSLNTESDEDFNIAKNHLKSNTAIYSDLDLRHLLSTVQFWGLSEIPATVLDFVVVRINYSDPDWLSDFEEAFPVLVDAKAVRLGAQKDKVAIAARSASPEFFATYVNRNQARICSRVFTEASAYGRLENLIFAYSRIPWTLGSSSVHCNQAAQNGHLECMEFLRSHGCPTDLKTCPAAAGNGHLDCAIYAHANGCPWPKHCHLLAAEHGHLDSLKYALDQTGGKSTQVVVAACKGGHLDCLQYVADNFKVSPEAYGAAARGGHIQCMQFLHERGCKVDRMVFCAAIHGKQWESLRYLLTHEHVHAGCCVGCALLCNSVEALKFAQDFGFAVPADATDIAMRHNSVACLQYLLEHSLLHLDTAAAAEAARNDGLEALQFAVQHGCPVDTSTTAAAAGHCFLRVLHYLHEIGCAWDATAFAAAIKLGSPEALTYLHEHGCPWDDYTLVVAAQNCLSSQLQSKALACLQYLLEHGCPRSAEVARVLAGAHSPYYLQYVHQQGCPWDETVSTAAEHCAEMLAYCVENGCPITAECMRIYNRNKVKTAMGGAN